MKCCVIECKNPSRFIFPKNEVVRRQWLEAIRRPDFKPKNRNGLCADHFKKEDIPCESYSGGYKTERVVLRRHIVPSVFSWSLALKRQEIKVFKNVGNTVDVKSEDSIETHYCHNSSYKKCLDNLIASPFQTIFIKSEYFESSDIDKDGAKICKQLENKESVNSFQVSRVVLNKTETRSERTSVNCTNKLEITRKNNFYVESDIRLLEHDYHIAKTYQLRPKLIKPRYNVEEFRNDPKGLNVFTGLPSYERFMQVLRCLGEKVKLVYCGNRSTGKLSVKNQLFLTLWKLKRNCPNFDLSRHFNISTVAVGNIFRTWVSFLATERPKIEIRAGKTIFEFYKLNRFKKYYA